MFDTAKFLMLGVRLQMRAKQLRENPPDTVEEYAELIEEIKTLSDQLLGQRKAPDFDTAALKAGRDADLAGYMKTDADLDTLPPLEPTPGDPTFKYYPDTHARRNVTDPMPFDVKRLKPGDEIYGDGTSLETSRTFTVWGGFGKRPPNWGAPLDTVK